MNLTGIVWKALKHVISEWKWKWVFLYFSIQLYVNRTSLRSKWVQLKRKKKRTNRILVIDSTVAATTFGLPKPNGVIIAGSCKYHRRLAHFLVNFKNQINKNINHRILEWMKTNIIYLPIAVIKSVELELELWGVLVSCYSASAQTWRNGHFYFYSCFCL